MNTTWPAPLPRWILPVLAVLFAGGCGRPAEPSPASPGDTPYTIVATTGMVTDLARRIAGDHAKVIGLIGSGVDPHLYQPTRADIATLTQADVVFYSGLHLEGRLTDALIRAATNDTLVVAVTERLDPSTLITPEDYEGAPDPHVWMDPLAWRSAAGMIADALGEHDPAHADDYAANAQELQGEIDALHEYARRVLESVPEQSRVLVTAHDAFNYFGRRYGIEVVGIQGISTESEAGVRDIERIVKLLVDRQIRAVFVETTVSQRNIKALIAGAKARGHSVTIGGSLFSDAMGPPGSYEGTYIGMIDHNVTTIARALGGDAPADGMNGQRSAQSP